MKKFDVPKGFKFLGKNIGIKEKKKDFAIAVSDNICSAAALFTKNSLCGVSIPIGKQNVKNGNLQAVVVTSGIANVATGSQGIQNTKRILNALSGHLSINSDDIIPSSTGVIGPQLPIDLIENSIREISMEELNCDNVENFVEAIMTTDTDTSTSDTLVAMASNKYYVDKIIFKQEIHNILKKLTMMIAKDGEGASKLIEVNVTGAQTFQQAKIVAKSIVNSPLVKASVYGMDPNWGRVIMAIGKVTDENISIDRVTIGYGNIDIYKHGEVYNKVEDIRKYLGDCEECIINVDLGLGNEYATVWGCDLTEEYVKINGSYTS